MQTHIARGYIEKVKDIKHSESVTNNFAAFKGNLKIGKEDVIVEVYSDADNFKTNEIFIKLSTPVVNINKAIRDL